VRHGGNCDRVRMSRAVYEIRVRGEVTVALLEDFGALSVVADSGTTTLRVDLADQSALHGLLNGLRRADLALVDVRREHELE